MEDYPVPDLADIEVVDVLRALSDPLRLQILRVLADGGAHPKGASDWGCDVTKATMSHHFRVLREAGLTTTHVDGRRHTVHLRRAALDARFPGLIAAIVAQTRTPARGENGTSLV